MGTETPKAPGALRRLAWLVIPVLLLAAASNYDNVVRMVRGQSTPKGPPVSAPRMQPAREMTIEIPEDRGPREAKVKLEVFLMPSAPCTCSVEDAALGESVGRLDPRGLRVAFWDLTKPETARRMKAVGVPVTCIGFAVNGHYKFDVPSTLSGSKMTHEVDFLAHQRSWTYEDVYEALAQQYEAVYHQAPPFDRARLVEDVSVAVKRAYAQAAPGSPMPSRVH